MTQAMARLEEVVREAEEGEESGEGQVADSFQSQEGSGWRYAPYWLHNSTGVGLRFWLSNRQGEGAGGEDREEESSPQPDHWRWGGRGRGGGRGPSSRPSAP